MPVISDGGSITAAFSEDREQVYVEMVASNHHPVRLVLSIDAAGALAAHIHRLFTDLAAEIGGPRHEFPGATIELDGDRTVLTLTERAGSRSTPDGRGLG